MIMFAGKKVIEKCPIPALPESRFSRVIPIDKFNAQDFNKNDAGWISNDISALSRAQSMQEVEILLKRLQEFKSSSNLPEGVKLKDAFNFIRPRACQSENEFVEFAGFLGEKAKANIDAAYQAEFVKSLENASQVQESDQADSE